jgi:DNA-binding MarR family transcriptional regulator
VGRASSKSKPARQALTSALMFASREYSTAAVLFHNTVAERFGLSVTDLKALDVLQRRGALTAGEIAMHTGLATPSVTSLIDRLEKKRLVKRRRDSADRRRVIVQLTPVLGKTIAPLFESLNVRMLEHFKSYGDRQLELIARFLTRAAGDMRVETRELAQR